MNGYTPDQLAPLLKAASEIVESAHAIEIARLESRADAEFAKRCAAEDALHEANEESARLRLRVHGLAHQLADALDRLTETTDEREQAAAR